MKLILQIAAGVLLGCAALLAAINVPKWAREAWRDHLQQVEDRPIIAVMSNMTPEYVAARCGAPTGERIINPELRTMTYQNTYSQFRAITLGFAPIEDGKWRLSFVNDETNVDDVQRYIPGLSIQEVLDTLKNIMPCILGAPKN
jgi:hypothetical protein